MGRNLGPLNIKDSYEGLVQISGSNQLTDGSGSAITSLDVTASYATNAGTATTASYVAAANVDGTVATATSASYATTASLALALEGGVSLQAVLDTGNTATEDITLTGDINATNVTSSFKGDLVGNADTATSASHAIFADTASFLPSNTRLNITDITASNASFTSASIGYLQTITGSAKIIGDAFIILNNNTPTERYAGLVVQDSGSTNNTASLEFDGQTNDWFYEYTDDGGVTTDHGIALFGPEYNTKGSPTYLTNNTIPKGDGGHHLNDSKLTDDGTTLSYTGDKINFSNNGGSTTGTRAVVIGGFVGNATGIESGMFASSFGTATGQNAVVLGGVNSDAGGSRSGILAGNNNTITSAGTWGGVVGGSNNTVQHTKSVTIGGANLATTKDDEVVVPHLTISGSTVATDISASGYVSASSFIGDGSQITGISAGKFNDGAGLESIVGKMLSSGSNSSPQGFLFASGSSITTTGVGAVTLGGYNNQLGGNGYGSAIIGGIDNAITGNFGSTIFGSNSSTNLAYFSTILGGKDNTLTSALYGSILGGIGNSIPAGNYSSIVGGESQQINGTHNVIAGGSSHINNGTRSGMLGGWDSNLNGGQASAIVGGGAHTLNANYTAIIAGENNSATHTNSVIVGGNGLSTSKDNEVTVNHLSIYGDTYISASVLGTGSLIDNLGQEAIVTGSQVQHIVNLSQAEYDALTPDANTLYVIDGTDETLNNTVVSGSLIGEVSALSIASTTASMDCSTGNYFTLTLANGVDTHLDVSNIQIGQTINLKLTNNATGAGTISFAPEFDFEGGTAFTATATTSAVDVLSFVSFDGTSLQTVGVKNFS